MFVILFTHYAGYAQKPELPTPPNGVWLYDNVFIDLTEVANIHWLEYQFSFTVSTREQYLSTIIDSTVWALGPMEEILSRGYYRHPSNRYYPVVGVTKQQAIAYCKWRTEAVNDMIRRQISANSLEYQKFKNYKIEVTYRLPTEEEWEMAAAGSLDVNRFPYGYKVFYEAPKPPVITDMKQLSNLLDTAISRSQLKRDIKEYIKSDLKVKFVCNQPQPYFMVAEDLMPQRVSNGEKNSMGLYNMIGNVAEMVDEDGVAKGGSWVHELADCKIESRQFYTKPTSWLGFRCVAEVRLTPIKNMKN